jgi:hypothetical protein
MTDLVAKVRKAGESMSEPFGPFTLFGLFMPADVTTWDLVLASPRLDNDLRSYDAVSRALTKALSPHELSRVGRIVILDPDDKAVRGLVRSLPNERDPIEVNHFDFEGVHVERAWLMHFPNGKPARPTAQKARQA